MKPTKEMIKIIQERLNKRVGTGLIVDGVSGAKTLAALVRVVAIPTSWEEDRQLIGYIQYLCDQNSIEAGPVDGHWGPQTEEGYEQLKAKLSSTGVNWWQQFQWRDDEGIGGTPTATGWPLQTQAELEKFYGKVGTNQVKTDTLPYKLKIAWAPSKIVTRFTCHDKVAGSIHKVLTQVYEHYGYDEIQKLGLNLFGGCLNVRKMRGGSKWSTHSWGMAIDWDPAKNKLRWKKDRATFAKPDYDMWWKFWEDEGWVSLGRARNYDWMHVQAAKVK